MPRVVITGAGTINALGHDMPSTFDAFTSGRGGIGPLDIPDVERLSNRIAGQVRDWTATEHFDLRGLSLYDRMTQFALWSARQAVAQSGLAFDEALALRSGVILGTAGGGLGTIDDSFRAVYAEGKNRVHPLTVPRLMASAGVSHISMAYGLRGPAFAVSTACASSNHAMGMAYQMVRSGVAPVMLTGGAEAMLTFGGLKAWEGLRVMATDACRPFSADRSGMVQGEGAAVFVFEAYKHARARGATILAEVVGFSMCSDAHDIVMPSAEGAERAMRGVLHDAGLEPGQVGYINAHGTGTKANDANEAMAIRKVFGERPPPVSSTKAAHGHVIGGTGAIEALACLMAIRDGVIAPTLGYQKPDPDCRLDVVPNTARKADVKVAMTNAFAFGGLNAVLILRRI